MYFGKLTDTLATLGNLLLYQICGYSRDPTWLNVFMCLYWTRLMSFLRCSQLLIELRLCCGFHSRGPIPSCGLRVLPSGPSFDAAPQCRAWAVSWGPDGATYKFGGYLPVACSLANGKQETDRSWVEKFSLLPPSVGSLRPTVKPRPT